MKKIVMGVLAAGFLGLASCNNAELEERVAKLESRIDDLEGSHDHGTPTQSASYAEEEASTDAASDVPASTISFDEDTHEFGTINEGDVVEHTFTFTNTGDTPLIIQDAKASCGCTVPKKPEAPVPPGETGEIQVRFNSQGKPGAQNKTITVTANTEPATTRLFIKADVTPKGEAVNGPVKK